MAMDALRGAACAELGSAIAQTAMIDNASEAHRIDDWENAMRKIREVTKYTPRGTADSFQNRTLRC